MKQILKLYFFVVIINYFLHPVNFLYPVNADNLVKESNAEKSTVEIGGIRESVSKSHKSNENLSEKINKIETNLPEPRLMDIKIIEKDTDSIFIKSDDVKLETTPQDIKIPVNLGDYTDAPFYLDTETVNYYEPKNNNTPISISEYKKFFLFIRELLSNKLYSQIVEEINEIQKNQLHSGEREKLNFIKIFAYLELKKNNEAIVIIDGIKKTDTANKYRAYLLFFQAKYFENLNQPDNALNEYLKVFNLEPEKQVVDDALFRSAELLIEKNDIKKAIEYLDIIIEKYAQSDYSDDAVFLKAKLFDTIKEIRNYSTAEFNYRKLYKTYPKSKHAKESQKRGEEIRINFL